MQRGIEDFEAGRTHWIVSLLRIVSLLIGRRLPEASRLEQGLAQIGAGALENPAGLPLREPQGPGGNLQWETRLDPWNPVDHCFSVGFPHARE
jgi:hypothetical protein